jgi:hypothetical protein
MKLILFISLCLSFSLHASQSGIKGRVQSSKECEGAIMVWVSLDKENFQERQLLMHTLVPIGGSFQFYLNPGQYQVRGSDKKGCETTHKVTVGESLVDLSLKVEPK